MLKNKVRGSLIVISGPTSAGKGTICSELMKRQPELYLSVSMTSRERRNYEVEGQHYFFVSKEDFEKKIKEKKFLEYAVVHQGRYYGTPKDNVEENLNKGKDVILEIEIQGALQVSELAPDAIFIFILPPDMKTLKERIIKRGTENKEQVTERIVRAYQEINEISKYNYVVVNDELEEAVEKVEAILVAEKCRVDRIEDVDLGNKEELLHELLMEDI